VMDHNTIKATIYSIKSFKSNDIVELPLNLCMVLIIPKMASNAICTNSKELLLYHCISMGCKVS